MVSISVTLVVFPDIDVIQTQLKYNVAPESCGRAIFRDLQPATEYVFVVDRFPNATDSFNGYWSDNTSLHIRTGGQHLPQQPVLTEDISLTLPTQQSDLPGKWVIVLRASNSLILYPEMVTLRNLHFLIMMHLKDKTQIIYM